MMGETSGMGPVGNVFQLKGDDKILNPLDANFNGADN